MIGPGRNRGAEQIPLHKRLMNTAANISNTLGARLKCQMVLSISSVTEEDESPDLDKHQQHKLQIRHGRLIGQQTLRCFDEVTQPPAIVSAMTSQLQRVYSPCPL